MAKCCCFCHETDQTSILPSKKAIFRKKSVYNSNNYYICTIFPIAECELSNKVGAKNPDDT